MQSVFPVFGMFVCVLKTAGDGEPETGGIAVESMAVFVAMGKLEQAAVKVNRVSMVMFLTEYLQFIKILSLWPLFQSDSKCTSFSGFAGYLERSLMLCDHLSCDRQPQSDTAE